MIIDMFRSFSELKGWYERIDIKDNLFEGWDSDGKKLKLKWNNDKNVEEIELLNSENDITALKEAIIYSHRIINKNKIITNEHISTLSPIDLFNKLNQKK